jgi:hypothetical protein
MNKLLIFSPIFLFSCIQGEQIIINDYSKNISLAGLSKNQIYEKSRQWITYYFISGKDVRDYENPSEGKIIAKGGIQISTWYFDAIWVVIDIKAEKGISKIKITPAQMMQKGVLYPIRDTPDYYPSTNETFQNALNKTISDYQEFMKIK